MRELGLAAKQAVSTVVRHEELLWLSLITSQGFNEATNSYRTCDVVREVQGEIR